MHASFCLIVFGQWNHKNKSPKQETNDCSLLKEYFPKSSFAAKKKSWTRRSVTVSRNSKFPKV